MDELFSTLEDRVRTITFNRPDKLNAFTYAMEEELYRILRDCKADPETSVVVIKGNGRSFCAGHDMNEAYETREPYAITSDIGDERARGFKQLDNLFSLVWDLPQPVIAQVQGHCFNFALELAMFADFVFAADDAKFVHRPVGGAAREYHLWPWLIGPRKAKEFNMLGQAVSGEEAERLGMVNRTVPLADLDKTVGEFAARLVQVPLELLALEKKAVNTSMEMLNLRPALTYSMELHALSHLSDTTQKLHKDMKTQGWREAMDERNAQRFNG